MKGLKKHQNLPSNWEEREVLRGKGQFWTPSWVAEAMISYLIDDKNKLIFDPAIGEGAFYEAFLKCSSDVNIKFYGRDVDPNILNAEIFKKNKKRILIEIKDFIKDPPLVKYKAIIANPPYIRHHRLDQQTKIELKKLCKSVAGFTIDGRAGYHIYFLIQALGLLDKGGKLAFIMPADTCEGKFATKLWKWVTSNFNVECVCTFSENATPFPDVDTNALVFFIKNEPPKEKLKWVRVNKSYSDGLINLVKSGFKKYTSPTLEVVNRDLKEALETGFSRPEVLEKSKYQLTDFASIIRGIATGDNDFFFLNKEQVEELNIPEDYLLRAVGRTRDIGGDVFNDKMLAELDERQRPTYLINIGKEEIKALPLALQQYLKKGEDKGLPEKSLIKQRKPWYKMEKRETPSFLFAYLGRRKTRFIKNDAGVVPLTGFLCVYPHKKDKDNLEKLWKVLNEKETIENLKLVGKSYGSGAIKVEPSGLRSLPIPEHLVKKYKLTVQNQERNGQIRMFREKEEKVEYKPMKK